jgi:hypothetical protein
MEKVTKTMDCTSVGYDNRKRQSLIAFEFCKEVLLFTVVVLHPAIPDLRKG